MTLTLKVKVTDWSEKSLDPYDKSNINTARDNPFSTLYLMIYYHSVPLRKIQNAMHAFVFYATERNENIKFMIFSPKL